MTLLFFRPCGLSRARGHLVLTCVRTTFVTVYCAYSCWLWFEWVLCWGDARRGFGGRMGGMGSGEEGKVQPVVSSTMESVPVHGRGA